MRATGSRQSSKLAADEYLGYHKQSVAARTTMPTYLGLLVSGSTLTKTVNQHLPAVPNSLAIGLAPLGTELGQVLQTRPALFVFCSEFNPSLGARKNLAKRVSLRPTLTTPTPIIRGWTDQLCLHQRLLKDLLPRQPEGYLHRISRTMSPFCKLPLCPTDLDRFRIYTPFTHIQFRYTVKTSPFSI